MAVDYSRKINWLSRPDRSEHAADTFYLYPSTYVSPEDEKRPFADIQDARMRKMAAKCLEIQGSAFGGFTDVYAPLYRQVDPFMGMEYIKKNRQDLVDQVILRDAEDSFMWYYENCNRGRPFFFAAHSQGSSVLLRMLAGLLKKRNDILENMVAAYLPGAQVDRNYMNANPHLKFAEREDDTGVILSWNTQMPGLDKRLPIITGRPLVINPINWRRDETYAPVSSNMGSLVHGRLICPGIADAKADLKSGMLECASVDPADFRQAFDFVPEGCFHSMDYGFYYVNIMKNAELRLRRFLEKSMKETD